MTTKYNEIFQQLLSEFNLPNDLSFSVDMPAEVQAILNDGILITEFGVTLESFNKLYKATTGVDNKSIIEDRENHFHVDWQIEPADNKKAFMLGVKTITLLAEKFQKEKMKGIRFSYSFQTPELALLLAKENNLAGIDDKYYISDRLSFYKLREGEELVTDEEFQNKYFAILTIDI